MESEVARSKSKRPAAPPSEPTDGAEAPPRRTSREARAPPCETFNNKRQKSWWLKKRELNNETQFRQQQNPPIKKTKRTRASTNNKID